MGIRTRPAFSIFLLGCLRSSPEGANEVNTEHICNALMLFIDAFSTGGVLCSLRSRRGRKGSRPAHVKQASLTHLPWTRPRIRSASFRRGARATPTRGGGAAPHWLKESGREAAQSTPCRCLLRDGRDGQYGSIHSASEAGYWVDSKIAHAATGRLAESGSYSYLLHTTRVHCLSRPFGRKEALPSARLHYRRAEIFLDFGCRGENVTRGWE